MILAHQAARNHHNSPSPSPQQQQQTILMQKTQSIDSFLMQEVQQHQSSSSTLPDIMSSLYFAPTHETLLMNNSSNNDFGSSSISRPLSQSTTPSFHQHHQRASSSNYPTAAIHRPCITTSSTSSSFYNPALRAPAFTFQHAPLPFPQLPLSDDSTTGPFSFEQHRVMSPRVAPVLNNTSARTDIDKHLRFHITLQAATAITQKSEESAITYLNRGQLYAIQLSDKHRHDGPITSTIAIMFHDPSHRRVAANYWKFWQSQQKIPNVARAVVIDSAQSNGITQVQCPAFDRITFEWNGLCGARIHVRFNCLSTDFSRIKGVKGIPLRINIKSTMGSGGGTSSSDTTRSPMSVSTSSQPNYVLGSQEQHIESSYCKIKLFRDKGAERKNKDDAKQASKQFEKMRGDDLSRHPMWLMYNQPKPYSVFAETPLSPVLETVAAVPSPMAGFDLDSTGLFPSLLNNPAVKHHSRTMTAPSTFAAYHHHAAAAAVAAGSVAPGGTSVGMWFPPSPAVVMGNPATMRWGTEQPIVDDGSSYFMARSPNYSTPGSLSSGSSNMHANDDFARQLMATPAMSTVSTVSTPSPVVPSSATAATVGIKRSFHGSPTMTKRRHVEMYSLQVRVASQRGTGRESKCIELERLSVDELKHRLCQVLSLHPSQVADVIWRRKDSNTDKDQGNDSSNIHPTITTSNSTTANRRSSPNDFLILVDDAFVAHHLLDYSTVTVAWEIKADGMVRLVLEH